MASKESLVSVLMTNNAGSVKFSLKHNKPRFVHISPSHLLIVGVGFSEGAPGSDEGPGPASGVTTCHLSPPGPGGWHRLMDWDTISPDWDVLAFSSCQSFLTRDTISSHSDSNHDLRRLEASRSDWWDVMTIVWPLEGTETYFTPNISIEAHYGTNSRWLTERRGDQR